MPRAFSASDRSVLIRFASSLPKGSSERKVILSGLTRSAVEDSAPKRLIIEDSDGMKLTPEKAISRANRTIREAKKLIKSAESYVKAMKSGKLVAADNYQDGSSFLDFTLPVNEGYDRTGPRDLGYYKKGDEFTHVDSDDFVYDAREVEERAAITVKELKNIILMAESFIKKIGSGELDEKDAFTDFTLAIKEGFDVVAPQEVYVYSR